MNSLNRKLVLPALIALLLSGCTVGPDYVKPGAEVPAAYREGNGWKSAEPRDHVTRGKWWEMFGDPMLNQLVEQVSVSNQTLAQAEANYRVAAAIIQATDAASYPTLSAGPGMTP